MRQIEVEGQGIFSKAYRVRVPQSQNVRLFVDSGQVYASEKHSFPIGRDVVAVFAQAWSDKACISLSKFRNKNIPTSRCPTISDRR